MYEGGMHQFEPWEEPHPDVTEAETDERWNKETIRKLAEALRLVMTTGVAESRPSSVTRSAPMGRHSFLLIPLSLSSREGGTRVARISDE